MSTHEEMLNWIGTAEVALLPHPNGLEPSPASIRQLIEDSRWRVVADGELPDEGAEVWGTTKHRQFCTYQYSGGMFLAYEAWGEDAVQISEYPVTHWRPLPKLPQEVE